MEDELQINWKERYFELLKKVEALEAGIRELREKLNTNSNNSSTPPSSAFNKDHCNAYQNGPGGSGTVTVTQTVTN